jgi:hypothetical protein
LKISLLEIKPNYTQKLPADFKRGRAGLDISKRPRRESGGYRHLPVGVFYGYDDDSEFPAYSAFAQRAARYAGVLADRQFLHLKLHAPGLGRELYEVHHRGLEHGVGYSQTPYVVRRDHPVGARPPELSLRALLHRAELIVTNF